MTGCWWRGAGKRIVPSTWRDRIVVGRHNEASEVRWNAILTVRRHQAPTSSVARQFRFEMARQSSPLAVGRHGTDRSRGSGTAGGTRTHKPSRAAEFESALYANSSTAARHHYTEDSGGSREQNVCFTTAGIGDHFRRQAPGCRRAAGAQTRHERGRGGRWLIHRPVGANCGEGAISSGFRSRRGQMGDVRRFAR